MQDGLEMNKKSAVAWNFRNNDPEKVQMYSNKQFMMIYNEICTLLYLVMIQDAAMIFGFILVLDSVRYTLILECLYARDFILTSITWFDLWFGFFNTGLCCRVIGDFSCRSLVQGHWWLLFYVSLDMLIGDSAFVPSESELDIIGDSSILQSEMGVIGDASALSSESVAGNSLSLSSRGRLYLDIVEGPDLLPSMDLHEGCLVVGYRQPRVQLSCRLHRAGTMGLVCFIIRGNWGQVTGTGEAQCDVAWWAERTQCADLWGCAGNRWYCKSPWLGHGL